MGGESNTAMTDKDCPPAPDRPSGSSSEPFRDWLGRCLLGESPMMRRVRERIIRAAAQDYPVLIVGETGTGKDVAANAIHQGSSRSKKAPVVVVAGGLGDTAW